MPHMGKYADLIMVLLLILIHLPLEVHSCEQDHTVVLVA